MTDTDARKHLLRVEDLHIGFSLPEGDIDVVRGVSFALAPNATLALVGESGSGKSVVSQAIMGILPKTASIQGGRILFDDPARPGPTLDIAAQNPGGATMRSIRGGSISIIFQEPMTSLSPVHTLGNQIGEALHLHRNVSDSEGRELVTDMLRLVGFPNPEAALKTYPFELSGGLRQRAMIAMALVCRPSLLIADEPTTALDVTIQAQILKLLHDLQAELDMAVLLITHDLGVVANMAKDVVVMYHGEIMERGSLEEIFEEPQHPYLKALLKAVPRFDMRADEKLVPIREISHRSADFLKKGRRQDATEGPILRLEGLNKSFVIRNLRGLVGGGTAVPAVQNVSFEISRGECLGLVGESGCGKTTLAKMIMRALKPDSGEITFFDEDKPIDVLKLDKGDLTSFRPRIQFVFQDPFSSLNPRMTTEEILTEPLVIHGIGDDASRRATAENLLEVVGLGRHHLKRYPHSFSGGQRQRIGIARALALSPDLLICDEPVSALDVSIQAQILNLLKELKRELGLTYLFISHNLAVVHYIADRIAVMCRGRLVELAGRDELFRNPLHPYTRALLKAVPEPDLKHPLDFVRLVEERISHPADWPEPFTDDPGRRLCAHEVAPGHFVRAAEGVNPRDLAEAGGGGAGTPATAEGTPC